MADRPEILLTGRSRRAEARLAERFVLHFLADHADRDACLAAIGERLRGVFYSSGAGRFDAAVFARMPALEIVALMGAGTELIDLAAARVAGVAITNAGGANAVDVAEFAVGLLLSVGREIPGGDAHVRTGLWGERPMSVARRVSGRPVGVLGLGHVGLEIARRCAAFDMPVSYHNRRRRDDVPYAYFDDPVAMARAVDVLMVAAPGGRETRHMVGRAMLDALGPDGILVNIGRGSIVDQAALADALAEGRLAAAALDVLEREPEVPPALAALPNLLVTPHQASNTKEALRAAADNAVANLKAHFEGRPLPTRVA